LNIDSFAADGCWWQDDEKWQTVSKIIEQAVCWKCFLVQDRVLTCQNIGFM